MIEAAKELNTKKLIKEFLDDDILCECLYVCSGLYFPTKSQMVEIKIYGKKVIYKLSADEKALPIFNEILFPVGMDFQISMYVDFDKRSISRYLTSLKIVPDEIKEIIDIEYGKSYYPRKLNVKIHSEITEPYSEAKIKGLIKNKINCILYENHQLPSDDFRVFSKILFDNDIKLVSLARVRKEYEELSN